MKLNLKYFNESWDELKKVSWPSRKQTLTLTVTVVLVSLAVAALVASYDVLLAGIKQKLFAEETPAAGAETTIPIEEGQ